MNVTSMTHLNARTIFGTFTALTLSMTTGVRAEQIHATAKQDYDAHDSETVIVTGTRENGKKARESLNPTDIIST